jgi:geranyl-CoA carboxylase alpha subunit
MRTIRKVLVANRGEIALRVMRTARQLGIRTVAVYSEADSGSAHVLAADQSVCVGPPAASGSYLDIGKILGAAISSGADAIHPGYGFLAENADFARACADAGLKFIGPGPDSIELMGSKRLSKIAMQKASVPCIPGYDGASQDEQTLLAAAEKIGFPLMVKASAGGGGKGMRLVSDRGDLPAALKSARSEALSAFGSEELILERAVADPRHIEIQVFGDEHGTVLTLGERDCSIQRRHQKVVEEAPSPFVGEALRSRMSRAAKQAAEACNYVGAGTVEFLVAQNGEFYFLEMNTRLQVEHPVTELVSGLDLVAWQFLVASGDPLPLGQDDIQMNGHAVEVRLYAEDPRRGFLPQLGRILKWREPRGTGIRVDAGIRAGQNVGPDYDPLLAKIVAHGRDRSEAIMRLQAALGDTCLLGLNSNRYFLERILRHEVFINGGATTSFIDENFRQDPSLLPAVPAESTLAKAALLFYLKEAEPTRHLARWTSAAPIVNTRLMQFESQTFKARLAEVDGLFHVRLPSEVSLRLEALENGYCTVVRDGVRERDAYCFAGRDLYLEAADGHFCFRDVTRAPVSSSAGAEQNDVKAPMLGKVVDVLVEQGTAVGEGQALVLLEAMKMEVRITAGMAGIVESISVKTGDQVRSGQLLARIEPAGMAGEG